MHSISVGYRFPKSLCARESHLGGEIGPIGEPSDPFRNVRHVYFLAQNGGELTVITSSYGGRKGGAALTTLLILPSRPAPNAALPDAKLDRP